MDTHDYTQGPRRHLEYPELTMYQMIARMSEQYPDAPAYEFYNKKTSYAQLKYRIDRAAAAMTDLGIRKGDAVTICLPNIPQAIDSFYAVNRIGAVANMIHPLSAEKEITYYLTISESRFILTLDMFYAKVKAAISEVPHPVTVLCARIQDELPLHLKIPYFFAEGRKHMKYPGKEDVRWQSWLKKKHTLCPEPVTFEKDRTAVILYSGGTTGKPKGVCLTDLNFNALGMQAREFIQVNLRPGLTMLSCMPMFHGFGLGINIHTVLIHGAECILMPSFNIKTYAEMLKKKKPNFIAGVPTIFEALLHTDGITTLDMSFLLGMFCGGDSLTVELKKKIDAWLKEHNASIQIREGYGLTECVTASCLTPKDVYHENSIGLPFPDMVYDIVKPGTDESLPPMEEGEIVLKGPTLMLGYLKDEEETAMALKKRSDGDIWLYSGDQGYMDEEGYIYFLRRMKRMIVTNGYNVYPDIIENELDGCPGVQLSCVIGVPDQRRGQRVRAYIVLQEGQPATEEKKKEIFDYLKKKVALYALPREIEFRDDLPHTLVGKVAYHVLEEEAQNS